MSTHTSDEIRREPSLDLILAPIGIDHWSEVRHVHSAALLRLTGAERGTREHAACQSFVYDPDYTDDMMGDNLWGAWLDGRLAGTAGWRPSDDRGTAARITAVFVDPMLARLGLGRRLVLEAEARARAAGFTVFTTRATALSAPFFEALGYEVTSHGVHALSGELGFPVVFMRRTVTMTSVHPAGPGRADTAGAPGEVSANVHRLELPNAAFRQSDL